MKMTKLASHHPVAAAEPTKLDQVDQLTLQNLNLRSSLLEQERKMLGAELLRKYGRPGETSLSIASDGTIVHAAAEQSA